MSEPMHRVVLLIPMRTAGRIRNAAPALGLSWTAILQVAVEHHVAHLEEQNGGPFPKAPTLEERLRQQLKVG
jgi:hypothetical protein